VSSHLAAHFTQAFSKIRFGAARRSEMPVDNALPHCAIAHGRGGPRAYALVEMVTAAALAVVSVSSVQAMTAVPGCAPTREPAAAPALSSSEGSAVRPLAV
jgi:hypothetical protein